MLCQRRRDHGENVGPVFTDRPVFRSICGARALLTHGRQLLRRIEANPSSPRPPLARYATPEDNPAMRSRLLLAIGPCVVFVGACSSSNTTPNPLVDPSDLVAPPSGKGFQMTTEDVSVPPTTEEQDCYF